MNKVSFDIRVVFFATAVMTLVATAGCSTTGGAGSQQSFRQTDVTCEQYLSFTAEQREKVLTLEAQERTVFEYTSKAATSISEKDFFATTCNSPANAKLSLYDLKWANAKPTCDAFLALPSSVQVQWAETVQVQQSEWNSSEPPQTALDQLVASCSETSDNSLVSAARLIPVRIAEAAEQANREPVVNTPKQPLARTITWLNESKYGYLSESTLTIGYVLDSPFQHPSDQNFTAGVACGFNAQKDAAIPLTLVSTNKTSKDYQHVFSYFVLTHSAGANLLTTGYLESQLNGSGSEFCEEPVAGSTKISTGMSSRSVLNPNDSIRTLYFVILKDYFSPRYPDGASQELESYLLIGEKPVNSDDPSVAFTTNKMTLSGKVSD